MKINHQWSDAIRRIIFVSFFLGVSAAAGLGQTKRQPPKPPPLPPPSSSLQSSVTRGGMSAEVSGTLTVNDGKTKREIKLSHVYASYDGGNKKADIDPSWDLLFSDRPLPEDGPDRELYVSVLAREGKFNGLGIRLDADGDIEESRAYCEVCTRPDEKEYWYNSEYESTLESTTPVDASIVAGTAHSPQLKATNGAKEREVFQYRVTFKVALDDKPQLAKSFSQVDNEPSLVYRAFYKAVQSEDLDAVRNFMAAEQRNVFDGPAASETLLRVKSFIKPFSGVTLSRVFGNNVAHLHLLVEGERQGVPSKNSRPATTAMTPPPSSLPVIEPGSVPMSALVRMVLENKQWKIYWLVEDRFERLNIFSKNYKTPSERAKTEEEAQRREEEEYFRVEDGSALAAGGGEAGKAYLDFCRAEKMGDKKLLVKYLTGEQYQLYSDPALNIKPGAYIWKESSALDYANIAVTGGITNQKEAMLTVKAVRSGYGTTGRVKMILENGQWKVGREKWATEDAKKMAVPRRN